MKLCCPANGLKASESGVGARASNTARLIRAKDRNNSTHEACSRLPAERSLDFGLGF